MKLQFFMRDAPHPARQRAIKAVKAAPVGYVVTIDEPTRTSEQSARMWAMLTDVAKQVDWYGRKLTPEDWKHVFSASLGKLDVVPNIDGTGFVALGLSTSRMGKKRMSDMIDLIGAFGAERGVVWTEPEPVAA